MFSDPYTVTGFGGTFPLFRISAGENSGRFNSTTDDYHLSISHTYAKRTRRMFRLDTSKIAEDPLFPANNGLYELSTYLVVDTPKVGFSHTEQKDTVQSLLDTLSQSSYAAVDKLLYGES